MSKTETIHIRVDAELKNRAMEAAMQTGKTLTTFATNALETATARAERQISTRCKPMPPHTDKPADWFKSWCLKESQGGVSGYTTAGYLLGNDLSRILVELMGLPSVEAHNALKLLRRHIPKGGGKRNPEAALTWFGTVFPKWVAIVPARRRQQFLEGVFAAADKSFIW